MATDKNKTPHPLTAKVTVYKIVEGQRYPFTATARWSEYYPGERMGFQWHQRPYLMLGKCAEALALRKAFPKLLSGMYAQEEMDKTSQADGESQKVETGFKTLMNLISTATLVGLEDFKKKMESSEKYTDAQKFQFLEAVKVQIQKLKDTQNAPTEIIS